MGRAQPERDLGQRARSYRASARQGGPDAPRHRGGRHYQPARDDGHLGQDDRRAGLQRDRLARDAGVDRFKKTVGLPLSTYFSGTKIVWILENVAGARARAEAGDLLFGTIATWVLWNLTGGVDGGVHATDVTNASRTLFLDLATLAWDDD